MKKLVVSTIIGLVGFSPVYGSVGPLNNTQILNLNPSKDVSDHFYCEVKSNKVKQVHFQNHNVLIDGFDEDGAAKFSGYVQLTKLNHIYFTANVDPDKPSLAANVVVEFDGEDPEAIVCYHGTGGRIYSY